MLDRRWLALAAILLACYGCAAGSDSEDGGESTTQTTTDGDGASSGSLFFLHHSVGDGLIVEGNMRSAIASFNAQRGTSFAFWDHGYNGDGLRNAEGEFTGTSYEVPGDNTDPDGLHMLWTSSDGDWAACRSRILANHWLIAFKSCFPSSAIPDNDTLQQYKQWYLRMRDVFDSRPDHVFVVMSTPPLHRLATNSSEAANARAFADWLCGEEYLSGHSNVACFDLFDHLAAGDGRLRREYEMDPNDSDSHPNALANQTVGPIFADFLCQVAASH
jgi:hypothetical protein